jgi:hypothetical protein
MVSSRDNEIYVNILAASEFGAAQCQLYGTPVILFHHSRSPLDANKDHGTKAVKQEAVKQPAAQVVVACSPPCG